MSKVSVMKFVLGLVMGANAALFFFGAIQHTGVEIGAFREPRIIPAAIVESVCGLSLLWGAWATSGQSGAKWRVAVFMNLAALTGVLLGIVALAMGAGPRTASNDIYHRIMLSLIGCSLLIIFVASPPRIVRKERQHPSS